LVEALLVSKCSLLVFLGLVLLIVAVDGLFTD